MAIQIQSITAFREPNENHAFTDVWLVQMSEGHRMMSAKVSNGTAEEAEAAAVAQFEARFPTRLED